MLAVHFHPAAAHQRESIRLGQQLLDLRGGERFTIQRDAHLEIEQRLMADA
jgi:hypothetical protein